MTPPQARWETTDRWHRTFPGKREQVREARRFIRAHLPHHPDAELIAGELVTNAVEHTRTGEPGGVFTALIRRQPDGTAYLEIEDQGGPSAFGLPTPDREGGRGLHLVAALTTAWGSQRRRRRPHRLGRTTPTNPMTQARLSLQALRERFPTWAFLHDPFANRWFALHGRQTTLTAATAEELAAHVTHFQTHPRPTRPQPRQ